MSEAATRRVLLLAAEPVAGPRVLAEVRRHLGDGDAELMVVAPSLAGSALEHVMGDVDDGRGRAEEILSTSLGELERTDASLEGRVGDADPMLAIEDALAQFSADEILIVTAPDGDGEYQEDELFDRARQRFDREVVRLVVDTPGAEDARVSEVERSAADEGSDEAEVETRSRNFPALSVRDVLGIAVAVFGSSILIILAAECGGNEVQRNTGTGGVGSDGGCVARYIIAGVVTLVNIAHVVGLFLFESVGYRGAAARAFAWLSLIGTPLGIALSLVVH